MTFSKEKLRCTKCKRMLCIRHFKDKNNLICQRCKKKIPTNPFYVSPENRKVSFGMTKDEKLELHQQHMRSGLCSEEAWKRVDGLDFWLKIHKRRYIKRPYTKEDFLRGLHQI